MKKTTITGLFILFTLCLFGQDWATDIYRVGEKYPGYIIKNDGTKIEGYIEAHARAAATPFSDDNQKIVTFFSDPKNKKTKRPRISYGLESAHAQVRRKLRLWSFGGQEPPLDRAMGRQSAGALRIQTG